MNLLLPLLAPLALGLPPGPATAQEAKKFRVEATVAEIAPKEKDRPGFLCEGTTDLPDGCRIDVFTYFLNPDPTGLHKQVPEDGSHRNHSATLVKNGRFSLAFSIYQERNLSGEYVARVVFDPNLQAARFTRLASIQADLPYRVGTPEDAERDRAAYGARLTGEIRALVAIADEAAARRKQDQEKGKADPGAWTALIKDWTRRAEEVNERAHQVTEYLVLGMSQISNIGVEQMGLIAVDIGRSGSQGKDREMREGRERLDIMVSNFEHQLNGPQNARLTRIGLAKEARGSLDVAVHGPGDRAQAARKRFKQVLFDIHAIAPADVRTTILNLMIQANEIFDALDQKKDPKALFDLLDARLAEILKGFEQDK